MSGVVVWFTGLPASGKSTLAGSVQVRLQQAGVPCTLLDGDDLRAALVPAPGYTPTERDNFYATLANLAVLLSAQGLVTLVAATAHQRKYRDAARDKAPRFLEVHVEASAAVCRERDFKGLYDGEGAAENLPGRDLDYEPPLQPEVIASGGHDAAAVERVCALVA